MLKLVTEYDNNPETMFSEPQPDAVALYGAPTNGYRDEDGHGVPSSSQRKHDRKRQRLMGKANLKAAMRSGLFD